MSNRTKLSYQTIAERSGLSIATISRVFNRSQSVSDEKRARVIQALRELGVDPSTLDLRPQPRNNMLIFNVPSLKNPFYSPIIEASRRTAKRFGYNLVVNENPLGTDLQSFIDLIRTSRAAGVILTNAIVPETVETIRQVVPVVTCCESATTAGVPYVTVDDESASENAVKYLISLGRRRIALINGPSSNIPKSATRATGTRWSATASRSTTISSAPWVRTWTTTSRWRTSRGCSRSPAGPMPSSVYPMSLHAQRSRPPSPQGSGCRRMWPSSASTTSSSAG